MKIEGGLSQISIGFDGQVWGVNSNGEIFLRTGITDTNPNGINWRGIESYLSWVSRGGSVTWGINSTNQVFIRQGVDQSK